MMRLLSSQPQEVVPVAGNQDALVLVCPLENGRVRCFTGLHFAQMDHPVFELDEKRSKLVGNVMIEEKGHGSPGDI